MLKTIFKRKSVRTYNGNPVSKEDLDLILKAADASPVGLKQYENLHLTVISNKDLPTDETKVPFIMGDLKEACVLFDRKSLSIAVSNTAADAFLTDVTLFRAIEREQVKMWDEEAFVYGEITLP